MRDSCFFTPASRFEVNIMAGKDTKELSSKIQDMEQRFKNASMKPSSPLGLGTSRSRPGELIELKV